MAKLGYGRVSSSQQSVDLQVAALRGAGCDIIRTEVASGASRENRPELKTLLDFIRAGDELVVLRIDRLARSIVDLQTILILLRARGASLRALEQPVDTSTASGKAFFDLLGVFAELENGLRRERQQDGIAAAKARGVYKGRPPSIDGTEIKRLRNAGIGPTAIARKLGIGRASVYRILATSD